MAVITERVFRAKVVEKLRQIPKSWWESIQQQSISGTPDVLGVINGYFIALEFKRSRRAEVSKLQVYKLNKISEAGGYARVIHPENFEEIVRDLYSMAA